MLRGCAPHPMLSLQADDSTGDAPQLGCMLRTFPFRTFDDIATLGLEVHVYCPSCYRYVGPIDLGDERLRGRSFVGARFVCGQARRIYNDARQVCGRLGHIVVRPRPTDFIPPSKSIPCAASLVCDACRHGRSVRPPSTCLRGIVSGHSACLSCLSVGLSRALGGYLPCSPERLSAPALPG